jgi:hypothetical protein
MNILNPKFKYTPAAATDIRKTFARIKRERELEAKRKQPPEVLARRTVGGKK